MGRPNIDKEECNSPMLDNADSHNDVLSIRTHLRRPKNHFFIKKSL